MLARHNIHLADGSVFECRVTPSSSAASAFCAAAELLGVPKRARSGLSLFAVVPRARARSRSVDSAKSAAAAASKAGSAQEASVLLEPEAPLVSMAAAGLVDAQGVPQLMLRRWFWPARAGDGGLSLRDAYCAKCAGGPPMVAWVDFLEAKRSVVRSALRRRRPALYPRAPAPPRPAPPHP